MSKSQKERREWWGIWSRNKNTFCRQQQTSEHSFYQWRKRLGKQVPVKFALVETNGKLPATAAVEVTLATGERLRIGPGVDAATLRAVVSALREPR